MIEILDLFGKITFKNVTLLAIITRNYALLHEKKIKDIRYAFVTSNYG
jgi:hypothetical protein